MDALLRLRVLASCRGMEPLEHDEHSRRAHADWQTINAALADGVPLLCIPDGRDQPDNAARVLAAGAGIRARKHTPPRTLRRPIAQALGEPALKQHAQALARTLALKDGASEVAAALEKMTGSAVRSTSS